MTVEQEFLLNLIRAAIDGFEGSTIPVSFDWDALIAEAKRQGVAVIASDGLQKLYDSGVYTELGNKELRRVKARWFAKTMDYEHRYDSQIKKAKMLGHWFAEEGIQTVVLKGFTVSSCYPNPSHRYSADLDCFLLKEGEHFDAYKRGNRIVEKRGIRVDRSFYKNSSFDLAGLYVENHKFCTPFRGNDSLKRFEQLLQGLILEGPFSALGDTGLLEPCPLASALFLTEHAYSHFLHEGLTLKHLLDWALFRRQHTDDVDWVAFDGYVDEYGFRRFFDAYEHVGEFVLGSRGTLTMSEKQMMDSIWTGLDVHEDVRGLVKKLKLVGNTLRAGWKYRDYASISMPKALWIQVKGVLFDRNPKI